MELSDLIQRFSSSRERQVKAIFSTLFIAQNRLQTIFDKVDSQVSLKQFMLLTMVRQSEAELTLTQAGRLLGCSRQNIKKLAAALEQKGFITLKPGAKDTRACVMIPTESLFQYFHQMSDSHQKHLDGLFQSYTDEEILTLFQLLMKLHPAIDAWEQGEEE